MSILKNWNKIKLKEICNFLNGDAYKDTDWSNSGVPIVRIQNLNDSSKPFNYWAGTTENRITIDNNDLLLAWSGTPGTSFGAHIWNRGFALLNQHIFKVIYDQKIANPFWLKYAINQILKIMIDKSHGAVGLRHVTKPEVENLEILLPPLEEQKRIIKIIETKLTAIEKAKIASGEQMVNCDLIKDKIYANIFKEYSNWKNVNLENLCLIERGGSPRPIENFLTKDPNGINWIKIGDARVDSKYIDSTNEKIIKEGTKHSRKVKKGDFILSNSMSFGRPYILNIDGCIHDGWLVFSNFSNMINKDYLYHILSSSMIKKQFENEARGAIVRNLNIDIVKKVKIPLPGINEQQQIVKRIESKFNAVEKVYSVLSEQSVYINALPSSILRKAFNGDY
jgi:restriction endonuclease S subunit